MTKLFTLTTGLLLCVPVIKAQTIDRTVAASDGGYAQTVQGSVAWTIGEPVSETYNASGIVTTMGFLQPEITAVLPTLIKEQGKDQQMLVFPNPVKEELYVDFGNLATGVYTMELTDALGKLIFKTDAPVSETNNRVNIKVGEVAAGAYFLKVSNSDFNKIIKINKVN